MMSYRRQMSALLAERATQYPVITVTGPRQAGKTTLVRECFPALSYFNLERPDLREEAMRDPRSLLGRASGGAIFDEVQRVPELLSWVQDAVDHDPSAGRFVLTGSHSFELMSSVTQSLAGRTAVLNLLPMSIAELRAAGLPTPTDRLVHAGGYPRVHAERLPPAVAMADYFATYVERDLRQLIEIRQLEAFRRFVRLAAGRVGQVLNLHGLASDAGVSDPTARAWVDLLEASFVVRRLQPWFANIGKRLVKSPKLYFCDTALAAWLIGIHEEGQLAAHPLRGALFENLVVMEFVKHAANRGQPQALWYWRDSSGLEVDIVTEIGMPPGRLGLVEIKSGQTVFGEALRPLHKVAALLGDRVARRMLVFGGAEHYLREGIEVVGIGTDLRSAGG
jgi:predicted AAA+ superfamily ATPase